MYLVTQDFSQGHPFFRGEHNKGHIVVNLGPSGIVVPSLNPRDSLQPMNWKGCKPLDDRKYFLLENFGFRVHLKDRETISK